MVVHDLRGPSTSIKLGSEQALEKIKRMVRLNFKNKIDLCDIKNQVNVR